MDADATQMGNVVEELMPHLLGDLVALADRQRSGHGDACRTGWITHQLGAGKIPAECYNRRVMKCLRVAVTVILLLVWGVFVPVAMAADHCAVMGGMCEGPCGASSTVSAPTMPVSTDLVSRAPSMPAPAVPHSDRPAIERPPKSLALPV